MLLERVLDLRAGQRQRHELVPEWLAGKDIGVGHRPIRLFRNIGADAARIGQGDHRSAILVGAGRGELRVGDDIAEHALAGIVGCARQRFRDRSRRAVGERRRHLVVGLDQRSLFRIFCVGAGAHDDIVGPGADDIACRVIEF